MSPIESMERLFLLALGGFVAVVLFVFFLRKLLCWMDERGWIIYSGDPPTYGTLGRALLELQGIAQPQQQYVLEAKEKEEKKVEAEDEGGPDDPTRHLRRWRRSRRRRAKRTEKPA